MAKITGAQSIPSELLDGYRANLAEARPDNAVVGKRYPYRVPTQQDGGRPSVKKREQRERFKLALEKFAGVDEETRERWYDAMPPWSSLLWYYNYFIMSALMGDTNIKQGGAGVIKSIQNYTQSIPTGGATVNFGTAVDPAKTVVMIWGASYDFDWDQVGDVPYAWAWPVYPVWDTLTANSIHIAWSLTPQIAATVAIQIIEYI